MESMNFLKNENVKSIITLSEIKKFGFLDQTTHEVNTLEDLKQTKPFMVLAKCLKNRNIIQEKFKVQRLNKNQTYLMGFGIYQQLRNDQNGNKLLAPNNTQFDHFYKPYEGQDLNGKTLLVIRTGGIGDLLFIQPNLLHLKEKYPTCKIIIACGPQYHSMLETWNCVNEIISLPVHLSYIINADYHAIFEGVIERCKEAKTTNAYNLFTNWLNLNLPDEKLRPIQTAKPEAIELTKRVLEKWNIEPGNFYLTQIRASSPIRTPRPSIWQNLFQKLIDSNQNIIVTDSPYMANQVDIFTQSFGKHCNKSIFNFSTVSKSLDLSIAMCSLSKAVIAPDSSFIHIAQSLNIPTFGIYGAFAGKCRLSTYKNCDWVDLKHETENCGPCFIHGPNTCKNSELGHPLCYDTIDIDNCIERIKKLTGE